MNVTKIKQFVRENGIEDGLIFVGNIPAKVQQELFSEVLGRVISIDITRREVCKMTRNTDGQLSSSHLKKF